MGWFRANATYSNVKGSFVNYSNTEGMRKQDEILIRCLGELHSTRMNESLKTQVKGYT